MTQHLLLTGAGFSHNWGGWLPGGTVVFQRTQVLSLRRTFQRTNRQYEAFKQAVDSMVETTRT
jgi:hypothetical protein